MTKETQTSSKSVSTAIATYAELDRKLVELARDSEPGDDIPCLEVTKDFFEALLRGKKSNYITYGNPGVKLFVEGTIDKIEQEENMSAEEFHRLSIETMRAERAATKKAK